VWEGAIIESILENLEVLFRKGPEEESRRDREGYVNPDSSKYQLSGLADGRQSFEGPGNE
jgi:hypothetical protein